MATAATVALACPCLVTAVLLLAWRQIMNSLLSLEITGLIGMKIELMQGQVNGGFTVSIGDQ